MSFLNLHLHFVAFVNRHKDEVCNLKSVFPKGCSARMVFNDALPLNLLFISFLKFVVPIVTAAASLQFPSLDQHLSPSLLVPSFDLMGQTAKTTNKYCASPSYHHSLFLPQTIKWLAGNDCCRCIIPSFRKTNNGRTCRSRLCLCLRPAAE